MNRTFKNVALLILPLFFVLSVCRNTFAQDIEQVQREERVKTIFDFRVELGLTDEQEQKIRTILNELDRDLRVKRAKLIILNAEIEELFQKEGDLAEIKRKLEEYFSIHAYIRYIDIKASRDINRSLTPEQLRRWREMQAAERRR